MAPSPTPSSFGGLWGLVMAAYLCAERHRNVFHGVEYSSHPSGRSASNHPNYYLLGFSAALAPKFHPGTQRAMKTKARGVRTTPLTVDRIRTSHRYSICAGCRTSKVFATHGLQDLQRLYYPGAPGRPEALLPRGSRTSRGFTLRV